MVYVENVESSETQTTEEAGTAPDSSNTEASTVAVGQNMCQVDIQPSTHTRRVQVVPAHKQAAT